MKTRSKYSPRKISHQFSCLGSENITKASQAKNDTNEKVDQTFQVTNFNSVVDPPPLRKNISKQFLQMRRNSIPQMLSRDNIDEFNPMNIINFNNDDFLNPITSFRPKEPEPIELQGGNQNLINDLQDMFKQFDTKVHQYQAFPESQIQETWRNPQQSPKSAQIPSPVIDLNPQESEPYEPSQEGSIESDFQPISLNKRQQKSDVKDSQKSPAKRRGRQKKDDDLYIQESNQKIQEIEAQYELAKKNNLSAAEKKKIRNKKTAMQSRIREKMVKMHLNQLVEEHSSKCDQVIEILVDNLQEHPQIISKIMNKLKVQKINHHDSVSNQFRDVLKKEMSVTVTPDAENN